MYAPTYWAKTYWTGNYWPPSTASTPIPPTPGAGPLQVGGDSLTMQAGTTFVTLTLSFTFGVSMRTE